MASAMIRFRDGDEHTRQVIDRLTAQFPELSAADIERLIVGPPDSGAAGPLPGAGTSARRRSGDYPMAHYRA